MKLLIITQKVDINDPILGFFHRWLEEFAKQCEKIIVICLEKGEQHLPGNVMVLSLGKEDGENKLKYLWRFYKFIRQERKKYDAVFIHMNQIYVILGCFFWKLWRKKIGLWYTHKSVTASLRIAEKMTQLLFTASAESFRIRSKKINILGHGIDIDLFKPDLMKLIERKSILMVGRISATKNQLFLLKEFLEIIKNSTEPNQYNLLLIGLPLTDADKIYKQKIDDFLVDNNFKENIIFCGGCNQNQVAKHLAQARLLVNLSFTGSLDKDVLEAMACNVPVLTANQAFVGLIPEKIVNRDDRLWKKIEDELRNQNHVTYRDLIIKYHNLEVLIPKIISFYQ
ncbi:glycosyltransferase [Patescibacteria group bacterium]|nr:glycosyltransferase [Patescibacteria group bacterium]